MTRHRSGAPPAMQKSATGVARSQQGVDIHAYASRYQSWMSQVLLSQPLMLACSLLLSACTAGRATTGMTTWSLTTISLHLISSAARLTGSSSDCDALWTSSYSLFDQRVMLRPCHLLALVACSSVRNCFMNSSGSGCVMV